MVAMLQGDKRMKLLGLAAEYMKTSSYENVGIKRESEVCSMKRESWRW